MSRWFVLSIIVLLFLTGCRFPGAVPPTVKIGLVAPFEGRYRYVGYDVIYAVRLAVREANAAGGVGGYLVELVAYDDGADPAMAAEQARKLAVDPQVVAAIGHFGEETTAAALAAYAEAGLSLVAPALLDPAPDGAGPLVLPGPSAPVLAGALLDRARDQGIGAVALVSGGGPLSKALVEAARAHGVAVEPVVSLAGGDAAAWLTQELLDALVVICDAEPVAAGGAAAALRAAGWEGRFWGGPSLAAADFSLVAGDAAVGARFVTPYPFPGDVEGTDGFVEAYRAVAPHVPPPGPLSLPAYQAAGLLLEALEADLAANGAPTRAGMAAALEAVELPGRELVWYRVGDEGEMEIDG